jgi:hypothetical protein
MLPKDRLGERAANQIGKIFCILLQHTDFIAIYLKLIFQAMSAGAANYGAQWL